MDAICFVLGLPAKYLRGKQLKDLIHDPNAEREESERGGALLDRPRRAVVRAVYILDDDEREVLELADDVAQLELARTVNSDGAASYKLNGDSVTLEKYNSTLDALGIIVAARNFLIFQVCGVVLAPRMRAHGARACAKTAAS